MLADSVQQHIQILLSHILTAGKQADQSSLNSEYLSDEHFEFHSDAGVSMYTHMH